MPQPDPETGSSVLLNAIIALLAPMFLWATGGDVAFARIVAMETLEAYHPTCRRSLITATKVIAFELAALWSLSQSMSEEISLPLTLRLRGNAVSLDRAAERNRQTLEHHGRLAETSNLPDESALHEAVAGVERMVQEANARINATRQPPAPATTAPATTAPATTAPAPAPAATAPAPATTAPAPAPLPAAPAPMPEDRRRAAWAGATAQVAREMTADMAKLPPKQRALEMMRVEALAETATALVSGAPLPPFPPGR
jgi:hypothetical protein